MIKNNDYGPNGQGTIRSEKSHLCEDISVACEAKGMEHHLGQRLIVFHESFFKIDV